MYVLAVALLAVTAAPTVFHAEHSVDQDCTVCTPRNQPLADLSDKLQVRPTEDPRDHYAQAPGVTVGFLVSGLARFHARAPPFSVFPA